MSRNQRKDKQKLLELLTKNPIVEVACKNSGVPRSTYYRWRKEDDGFELACDEVIELSASRITDMAESQLINAIKDQNMTAIIFWLKHHHKSYKTRIEVDARVQAVQQELTPEQAEVVSHALQLAGLTQLPQGDQDGQPTTTE